MSIHLYTPTEIHTLCSLAWQHSMWDNLDRLSRRTSVVSALAAVGSLTGSRQRVPQGADGRILDPQRRTHQQQHRLPGALHPAPPSASTSFTLTPPGRHRDTHTQWDFISMHFLSFIHVQLPSHFLRLQPSTDGHWAALAGAVRILAHGHLSTVEGKICPINFSHPDVPCQFRMSNFVL